MSQQLQVLKCYSCETFQVHIVKKAKKWECKMCGEKQSTKKVYGQGSGADCRRHVQLLNGLRQQDDASQNDGFKLESDIPNENVKLEVNSSKWDKYLSVESENSDCDEERESEWPLPNVGCKMSELQEKTEGNNYNEVEVCNQSSSAQLNFNLFGSCDYDIFEVDEFGIDSDQLSNVGVHEETSTIDREAVAFHKSLVANAFCEDECNEEELDEILRL